MPSKGIQYKLISLQSSLLGPRPQRNHPVDQSHVDNETNSVTVFPSFIVIFFFILLSAFGCGSFVFYDVGSFLLLEKKKTTKKGCLQKVAMGRLCESAAQNCPYENIRKKPIIIINELSTHNTFYFFPLAFLFFVLLSRLRVPPTGSLLQGFVKLTATF